MNESYIGYHLTDRWLKTVCTRNVESVLRLYEPDAILIGTLSDRILVGDELEGYFHMFLSKQNLCGKITDLWVQTSNQGYIITSGLYTFSWLEYGRTVTVPARFSFVFIPTGRGDWLITNHHSSQVP